MTWSIRTAEPSEAPQLSTFAATLFRQAYETTHPEPTLSEYLASSFGIPRTTRTLEDPESTVLLVVSSDGSWIGYAEIHKGAPTAPTTVLTRALPGSAPLEIVRFYIDEKWHGQGVAQALMRACEERGRKSACDVLWLQAWQQAHRALQFYSKTGFEIYGTAVFNFGEHADGDVILARGLTDAHHGLSGVASR
jgi:GNAT superfamily N-acetyltransferase